MDGYFNIPVYLLKNSFQISFIAKKSFQVIVNNCMPYKLFATMYGIEMVEVTADFHFGFQNLAS